MFSIDNFTGFYSEKSKVMLKFEYIIMMPCGECDVNVFIKVWINKHIEGHCSLRQVLYILEVNISIGWNLYSTYNKR